MHIGSLFMLFVRSISQLRIFHDTRYLIRMITEVVGGMISFLIILFTSTLAFAVVFYKIRNLDNEFKDEADIEDFTYRE